MRHNIYPEDFLNKVIYHKKKNIYYWIQHLPKKYSKNAKTHSGEYFTRVIRLTDNDSKSSPDTVLHINLKTIKNIELMKLKNPLIRYHGDKGTVYPYFGHIEDFSKTDFKTEFITDKELTKDFHEYIKDIHEGIK